MNAIGGGGQGGNPPGYPPAADGEINEKGHYTPAWRHEYHNAPTVIVKETDLMTSVPIYHTFQGGHLAAQEFVNAARDYGQLPEGYVWSHQAHAKEARR